MSTANPPPPGPADLGPPAAPRPPVVPGPGVVGHGTFLVSLAVTVAVLVYLIVHPGAKTEATTGRPDRRTPRTRSGSTARGLIRVAPGHPLGRKLTPGRSPPRTPRSPAPGPAPSPGRWSPALRPGTGTGAVSPGVAAVVGAAAVAARGNRLLAVQRPRGADRVHRLAEGEGRHRVHPDPGGRGPGAGRQPSRTPSRSWWTGSASLVKAGT